MSTESEPRTTANVLGKFRKELTENGIPDDVADDLVREAGITEIRNDGWSVKR
ncbi:hypothetical protein [Cellulosimicrobium sp. SL-1]|uniref:hypothetical protein n=1 Tax=Cellulosimicrobium sp. SL-1 TaxID=2699423 RepID=UPI0013D04C96|nr:hypothetical protein [Cellulosimicrobium sp. SL-1]